VEVGKLLHIREYIGKNHEYATLHAAAHQVEYYFICDIINETNSFNPSNPDPEQVGVEWLPIGQLLEYPIFPKEIRKYIMQYLNNVNAPVYLGDIN
jgi:8-oxo-dGTP diphosphatase